MDLRLVDYIYQVSTSAQRAPITAAICGWQAAEPRIQHTVRGRAFFLSSAHVYAKG